MFASPVLSACRLGRKFGLVSETSASLSIGQIGEVAIRGPNVMTGYSQNPEANDQAFTEGWFRTGDQGYLDAEGYLFLTGRLKEQINRGGEKIAPLEIDQVLLQHSKYPASGDICDAASDLGRRSRGGRCA